MHLYHVWHKFKFLVHIPLYPKRSEIDSFFWKLLYAYVGNLIMLLLLLQIIFGNRWRHLLGGIDFWDRSMLEELMLHWLHPVLAKQIHREILLICFTKVCPIWGSSCSFVCWSWCNWIIISCH
ncbi:unnamed protein product, partial [Vitis vinifera]|uniref:Uncharacterized protein n=1 Tax=Vitis vinifera TaxID=29760 RepID=D7SVR8_VITVI